MILEPEDPRQMEFGCRADLVAKEPLVQSVDQVVEHLDLRVLYSRYSEGGRAFFDPAMQLKVLFFSYCDGVRSCRAIAKHIRYDIRYHYFCGSLRPDFRTINRFRKDNLDLLSGYFAQMILLFEELGLVDASLLALDGTKIRASSSGGKKPRGNQRDRLAKRFREQLAADASNDLVEEEEEPEEGESSGEEVAAATVAEDRYNDLADPDARYMKTSEGGKRLSYNSHVLADANQVIVAADVTNNADDSVSFPGLLRKGKQVLGRSLEGVVADGGYYSGENLRHASEQGIDLYLPVSNSGGKVPDERFDRDCFVYDAATDTYLCPQGERLQHQTRRRRHGANRHIYSGTAATCGCCVCRERCSRGRVRKLEVSENYPYQCEMKAKLSGSSGKKTYRKRKWMVEPVFGNIKFNLGFTRFRLRTLPKVRGEFLLICIAHNLRKLAGKLISLPPRAANSRAFALGCTLFRSLLSVFSASKPFQTAITHRSSSLLFNARLA